MGCIKCVYKLSDISRDCFFKIFDTQVQPVLLYASELWGLHRLDRVEKVHTLACKRFLNVYLRVPNKHVYGELGRYPLYVNSSVRCFKYWFKLLKMDRSRIPKQAYIMLKNIDEKGKTCWVTYVKNTLFRLGYGIVWLEQGIGNEKVFLVELKQRLIDTFSQEWHSSVVTKDVFSHYCLFKDNCLRENYFDYLDKRLRDAFVKLRLGVLPLGASSFRRLFANNTNTKCKLCLTVEDERHFIFDCPLYSDIRKKYITALNCDYISLLKFGSANDIYKLAMFLFLALKRRQIRD